MLQNMIKWRVASILSSSVITLSTLKIYLNIGLYFSLALLGGSSLVSLNGILYPFVPHLYASTCSSAARC